MILRNERIITVSVVIPKEGKVKRKDYHSYCSYSKWGEGEIRRDYHSHCSDSKWGEGEMV